MGNKNDTFGSPFGKFALVTIVSILIVCIFPWLFTMDGFLNFRNTGEIGDTIGGIMGPFIAIIASILTFLAFWVQYKANEQQRRDTSIERFENNLFQMIAQHESITDNLRYSTDGSPETLATGRAVFEYIYLHRQLGWHKGLKMTIFEEGIQSMKKESGLWCLDHYFRHLYRIVKYIDNACLTHDILERIEDRYQYLCIVRSMLSEYELVFLYYNALANDNSNKFKTLIERYALLNNLRFDLLATADETKYYSELCANRSISIPDSIKMTNYSKRAFIFLAN